MTHFECVENGELEVVETEGRRRSAWLFLIASSSGSGEFQHFVGAKLLMCGDMNVGSVVVCKSRQLFTVATAYAVRTSGKLRYMMSISKRRGVYGERTLCIAVS